MISLKLIFKIWNIVIFLSIIFPSSNFPHSLLSKVQASFPLIIIQMHNKLFLLPTFLRCLFFFFLVLGPVFPPFYVNMSIGIVLDQVLFKLSYCWGIIGQTAPSFLEDRILQQISWSSGSYCPFFCYHPWSLGAQVTVLMYHWGWAPSFSCSLF